MPPFPKLPGTVGRFFVLRIVLTTCHIAINLLEHLLQFEPSRRLDAHEATVHPYFTAGPIAPPHIPSAVSAATSSLALPPRVAARASQASAAVQAQQHLAQQEQVQQQVQQVHMVPPQQQYQYMMQPGNYYSVYSTGTPGYG